MPPSIPVAAPALIGRGAELADLLARLERPESAVVLLGGDAGVGKTRLLTELMAAARERGVRVLLGHCLDLGESGTPYLPLHEMFARLQEQEPPTLADLTRAHPRLDPLLPQATHAPRADPSGVFEAVAGAFVTLAHAQPLLVIIEDAHWADRSTRELLTFVLSRQVQAPLTLVVSFRTDDLHRRHPLRRHLGEWARLGGTHRMRLDPLADHDLRSLLALLRPDLAGSHATEDIVARAGGNPFYAEELVAAHELSGSRLPWDLAELLLVRVDALAETPRAIIRAASASARAVDHELLRQVTDLDDATLDAGLRAVLDANVFTASGSGYRFRHALMGEAVYDDLLPGERVRLHRAYVAALDGATFPGAAAALTHHARASGQRDVAIAAAVRAGDEAIAGAGPADGAQLYQDALTMLAEEDTAQPPSTRFEITLRAAAAFIAAADPYRAIDLLADVTTDGLGPVDQGRLAVRLAEARQLTDSPEPQVPMLLAAIEALAEPSELVATLYAKLARAYFATDDFERAVEAADEAVQLASQLQLPAVTADAMTTLARLDDFAGRGEQSLRRLDEVIEAAQQRGHAEAELRGRLQRHRVLARLDDHVAARDEAVAAVRRAAELDATTNPQAVGARLFAGLWAVLTGAWSIADEMLDVRELRLRESPVTAELHAVGAALDAARGNDERVLDRLAELRPMLGREMLLGVHGAAAAMEVLGRRGDVAEMLALHDELIELVDRVWDMRQFDARIRLSAIVIGHLATAPSVDHADRVAELSAVAEDVAQSRRDESALGLESRAWLARVRAERARFAWQRGTPPSAELLDLLRSTVDLMREASFPYEEARSRTTLAEVLAAAGDTTAAREEAAAAREIALRLGSAPLLGRLGRRGRGAAKPADAAATELTAREREVLALVAEGLTNGAIAKRLFISTKTASVHVSNILAKLGVASRTEAATHATRDGLLS